MAPVVAQCALLLALLSTTASAQWPLTCATLSPWNSTHCPATASCCPSSYSSTKVGCCPFENGVCCGGSDTAGTCCPAGSTCVKASGTSVTTVYNCTTAAGAFIRQNVGVCKPGVMLPLSTTLKNVLVIGDSLSIGYLPSLRTALADIALVQHAPADTADGGAEETAYALQCMDYWLHSPSGLDLGAGPDLILFNSGMHNYRANPPVPGQEGNSSVYPGELEAITNILVDYTKTHPKTKLVYALTTAQMCSAQTDDTISKVGGCGCSISGTMI